MSNNLYDLKLKRLAPAVSVISIVAVAISLLVFPPGSAAEPRKATMKDPTVQGAYFAQTSFFDAKVTASDLDGDGKTELLLGNSDGRLYCFDSQARVKWIHDTGSRSLDSAMGVRGAPACYDVDGDGNKEVFVGDLHGNVWGLDSNGQILYEWGWPKQTVCTGGNAGVYSSPAIGDINGDGLVDIVVGNYGHFVHAWSYTGDTLPGWPFNVADTIWSSPALADIDKDGLKEVIVGADCTGGVSWPYPPGGLLFAFNGDGTVLDGFPRHSPEVLWSSPAVGDIDGDGWQEIVIGTGHYYKSTNQIGTEGHVIYAFNHDGSDVAGWPAMVVGSTMSSPAIADINRDGSLEVVAACNGCNGVGEDHVLAIRGDGKTIWSVYVGGPHLNSPVLGDVNGDGAPDLVIPSGGAISAYTPEGWELFRVWLDQPGGNLCITTAAIGDFDDDGIVEIAYGTGDAPESTQRSGGSFYVMDCGHESTNNPWPMFHRDEQNQGTVPTGSEPEPPTTPPPMSVPPANFHEYILLMNPGEESANAKVTLVSKEGLKKYIDKVVPPNSRKTVHINAYMPDNEVCARVDSDKAIICERAMYFFTREGYFGGHDTVGATEPSATWYMAEGYTAENFEEYLLIQNPNPHPVTLNITYMVEGKDAIFDSFDIVGDCRHTTNLKWVPGLQKACVSTKLEASAPVICERAMYFNYSGLVGGHNSMPITQPASRWYLPEGYTAQNYDTYICIQNPNNETAGVGVYFLRSDGFENAQVFALPPLSRKTVMVDAVAGFEAAEVSTEVISDKPVIAERAMYFCADGRTGGHDSIGVTDPAEKWYLAEGYTGGTFDTYVLIMNPGHSPANVETTFMRNDGHTFTRTDTLAARSRFTIHVDKVPGFEDAEVSTLVEAKDGSKVIAERAMYFLYNGVWHGGHDSIGVTNPSKTWYFAEGYTGM